MSTPGKPNTFFKGMKTDMEESMQLKDSYRYAKNARVSSHDGDSITMQPYPSDRLALTFRGEASYANNVPTLSCMDSWLTVQSEVITIGQALEYAGVPWPPELASLEESWGPIQIPGQFTNLSPNPDNPITMTIELETIDGNSFTMVEDITTVYNATQVWNIPFDADTVVSNIISQSDNGIIATASINGNIGDCSSTTGWVFVNTENSSDYVSSFSVSVEGTGIFSISNQSLIEQYLINTLPPVPPPEGNNLADIIAYNLALGAQQAFVTGIFNAISDYYNSQGAIQLNTAIINNQEAIPGGLSLFEQAAENLGFSPDQPGIQILGTYSFSDQLIILAKWPLMGVLQAENGSPVACDLVIKVKSAPDGTLSGEGVEGVGDFIPFEGLGPLYTIYYVGDLEFSLDKKIKMTGSEESGKTRRIYFTDGLFPLKTMNVGLDPALYAPYMYIPEYFNIFTPAIFSSTKVTGFLEGGNLDSISYSYCFRYKTVDGRTSRLSPLSNPASLPVTAANIDASYVKGANAGQLTGKTMIGEIRNLDSRYSKIQLIYVPYIENSPSGPGIVFNEYPVPAINDINDESFISWKHTGTEQVIEEITIAELSNNQINWDTCQAMETKDNRLFVGNLSNSIESIDTDFRVTSYNDMGQTHDISGNPNLYNDLMYSSSGLIKQTFGGGELWVADDSYGAGQYMDDFSLEDSSLYRYIRGPANAGYNPVGYTGEILGLTQRRGIFGAQSRGFDTLNEDGEYEGIRVTFRILSEDSSGGTFPIDLDRDAKLLQEEGFKANSPYYKLPVGQNGYYNNYSNPLYNSNYVGYRRGEIYRFGLLFYDRLGSPMFIKPIGDVRMPEHSAEYVTPIYNPTSEEGDITGFKHEWPYYYQTSRDPKDQGFEETGSYENKSESKACVLYPYFEVKLSSQTTSKIGGYSIVRVPRDHINRTIVTSGIFSRAIKYHEDTPDDDTPLTGKFGNGSFPFWTELRQKGLQGNAIARFGGGGDKASRVYTLDSPDVMCDSDFIYNHSTTDRIKLIESGFCQKQNVHLANADGDTNSGGKWKLLNIELSDQGYNTGETVVINEYSVQQNSINMFASVLTRSILESVTVNFNDVDYETGTWWYRFSNMAQDYSDVAGTLSNIVTDNDAYGFDSGDDLMSDDPISLGYFTKYYSKRVACYPQYALRDTSVSQMNGGENSNHVGTGVGFNIGQTQYALRTPFTQFNSSNDNAFYLNHPHTEYRQDDAFEGLNTYFETEIHYAKILNPEDEIPSSNIPGDSENYKNAHIFHELYAQDSTDFDKQQKKDIEDNDMFKRAKYAPNSKTIGIVLNKPGGLPVVRQSLAPNNLLEGVIRKLGIGDSVAGGDYSPEITIASITRKQNRDTMYGGFTEGDFSRNIFQSTGQFKPVFVDFQNPGQDIVQKDVGEGGNAVFGGDTYIGYHKYKKTFKEGADAKAVCFASMIPLECDFNIDLRHGWNFSNGSDNIPKFIEDEYKYNTSFDSQNNLLAFQTKPVDWVDVNHWPCMVAWSEQKTPGEVDDNYSIFPPNQIEDLDYTKGPITQMFLLSNQMYALQYSGTCHLSVNPRVLIPSEDGTAIQASTGSGKALERYDYISGKYGSQHFHGLAVSDAGAYYYDDNHCKFLRLGKGQKGALGVVSIGDTSLMQSYFNKNKNNVINDNPLTIRTLAADALPPSSNYDLNKLNAYQGMMEDDLGGISIGFDSEYNEVLFTLMSSNSDKEGRYLPPETIVYNENIKSFTSFLSKTPAIYFNYDGRLYSVYNTYSTDSNAFGSLNHGLDEIYMSNGWEEIPNNELPTFPARYLNFGDIDYYIWENQVELDEETGQLFVNPVYKEPFEVEFVVNDSPVISKLFDKIQLNLSTDTPEGGKYIYFRKFAFKGSANSGEVHQYDTNSIGQSYSNIDNLEPGQSRTWYTVKDGMHFFPMRTLTGEQEADNIGKTRGAYATVNMTMGWGINNEHPSGYDKIKNEKFNIFSAVPFFRTSRI